MSDKKPSGAQNRKRRALEAAEDAGGTELSPELKAAIGEPPSSPTDALPWVVKALMLMTHEIIKAPGIVLTERARHVREMAKSLGMVYPRAELEALLKEAMAQIRGRDDKSGGTTPLADGAWKTGALPEVKPS